MAMRYWELQDFDDPSPYAVIAADETGLTYRYVPGEGLVDWPAAVMFTDNGEPGAREITEEQALALVRKGVGVVAPDFVAAQRGKAPVLPLGGLGSKDARSSP